MGKYLLRRILQMIPVVLGTTLLVYALVFALPGDPVKAMFGDKPVNEAVAAQIRAEYNLDKPFIVQYLLFLKNALTLDFGKTFSGQLVIDVIGRAFPVTIKLALMAFVFEAVFGVIFGVISGLKKGKWCDTVILIFSLLLISVPTFVTGFLCQYFLGVKWHLLPVTAGANPGFLDLLMPAMVLGSVSMAYIIRLSRTEISSNIALDYVRTARAKGVPELWVVLRHALKNAIMPVVTYLGPLIAGLLTGSFVVERLYAIPGIGRDFVTSISDRDYTMIMGITIFFGIFVIICNLIVDIAYAIIDPRVKIGAGTTILPGTILRGETVIGEHCTIGPNAMVRDCTVGDFTEINASQTNESAIGSHTTVGPFAYVRPNSTIGDHVKVGDFVEIKNSVIGNGTKISHLTYVGDSDCGERVNFGCGTVTTNYDGFKKYRCTIGDDSFIGCNTNLIAPVKVGEGSYIAAGSTITDDVPADALALARMKQTVKEGWAARRRALLGKKEK